MSSLLPEGVEHLGDCPYTLHEAIVQGLRILQYEEFPIEERPPRRIWMDGDKLTEWWKQVEIDREEKYKVGKDDPPPEEDDWDENAVTLLTRS